MFSYLNRFCHAYDFTKPPSSHTLSIFQSLTLVEMDYWICDKWQLPLPVLLVLCRYCIPAVYVTWLCVMNNLSEYISATYDISSLLPIISYLDTFHLYPSYHIPYLYSVTHFLALPFPLSKALSTSKQPLFPRSVLFRRHPPLLRLTNGCRTARGIRY